MLRFALFSFLITLSVLLAPAARAYTISTEAKQAFIMDADTGQVLFEKNADEKMPTSSMSKVMTMYMVFEALNDGRLQLDTQLQVSEKAWKMAGSKMFVEVGNAIRVEDLVQGVIVQSGNDATVVLAEGLGGTEESFAAAMTAKAREMGMENSNFVNASGWPDENHYSTARDLATLALRTIKDFPDMYGYYAHKEFTYHGIRQPNRNPLLYKDLGADGIKTGHTDAGGYGLMASGTRNGRRVIMVLNGMKDNTQRSEEAARLLDWALRDFDNVSFFKPGEPVEEAPVIMGKSKTVPLIVQEEMFVTVPKFSRKDIKVQAVYNSPLEAPVAKGQQVGTLTATIPGHDPLERPLLAGADVARLGFFAGTVEKLKLLISSKLSPGPEEAPETGPADAS